jgi:hypothetical protein
MRLAGNVTDDFSSAMSAGFSVVGFFRISRDRQAFKENCFLESDAFGGNQQRVTLIFSMSIDVTREIIDVSEEHFAFFASKELSEWTETAEGFVESHVSVKRSLGGELEVTQVAGPLEGVGFRFPRSTHGRSHCGFLSK